MENNDSRWIEGYCIYCKEEISNEDVHVVDGDKKYHLSCYLLLTGDTYTN